MKKILFAAIFVFAAGFSVAPVNAETQNSTPSLSGDLPDGYMGYVPRPEGSLSRVRRARLRGKGGLGSVCRTISAFPRCLIYKNRQSPHIPNGDPRKNGISLIELRGCSANIDACVTVYNSKGVKIATMGAYNPPGASYDRRVYTGSGCGGSQSASSIVAASKRGGANGKGYFKIRGGTCVVADSMSRCMNSVGC